MRLCRYLVNTKFCKVTIKKLYKIKLCFRSLRYLEKILDEYGIRIYQYKFLRKSKKLKEDSELVLKNDQNLETFFDNSKDAQTIFKDLNKYS